MDSDRQHELEQALARMRAAFADVPEEQILEDVAKNQEADREQRRKASKPRPA